MSEDQTQTTEYHFGPFTLNVRRHCLLRDGEEVPLRPKAFDVLHAIVARAGDVVSKDELVAKVWSDVIVNDDALSQCIRDVRKALGNEGQDYIRTIPRRGYSFVADVSAPSPNAAHSRRRLWPALASGLLAASVLLAFLLWPAREGPKDRFALAVLPFATLPDRSNESWLGDGIAEDILIELSRFHEIVVIDRGSSFRYGSSPDGLIALRNELGADFVLQGSVRLYRERVRIALQLVDTSESSVVWAERYDGSYAEMLDIRLAMLNEIVGELTEKAQDAVGFRAASAATEDLAVYELVLRARRSYYRFEKEEAFEVERLIKEALERDPNYAAAWEVAASVAFQFYIQRYDGRRGDQSQLDAAIEAARKAVSLDPEFSTAISELASLMGLAGHYEAALEEHRRAISLNPGNASIHRQYADTLSRAGYQREALAA